MAQLRDERSLGELFSDLTQQTSTLLRQEVQLAKAELTQSVTNAGRGVGLIIAGGVIAYAGFLAILSAIILVLWQAGLEGWLAALLVGLVVGALGVILVLQGRSALKVSNLAPQKTVKSLKEDTKMVKEQLS